MNDVRQVWLRSQWYRIALIAAIVYVVLRMAVHVIYLSGYGQGDDAPSFQEQFIPNDLKDYLEAAQRLESRQDLYLPGKLNQVEFYQYAPSYALGFTIFLRLPAMVTVVVHTLLHLAAYAVLYIWWGRIFRHLGLERANKMSAQTLPVWLVFGSFWSDLGFLNIYIVIALAATFLIEAVLHERLAESLFWISAILQVKPQWAFAAGIPFLMGSRAFFFKLLGGAVLIYAVVTTLTVLAVGPSYGWPQQVDYYRFLWNLRANFPWRGPDSGFMGYNHSITQVVVYLFGVTPAALQVATVVKIVALLPLAALAIRYLWRSSARPAPMSPQRKLEAAFALYLGAFIWLDMVWELTLGIVLFVYLLAVLDTPAERAIVWSVFLPYALLDIWRLGSYLVLGDAALAGAYILTDPSIYVPMIMLVILTFYAFMVRRLWAASTI